MKLKGIVYEDFTQYKMPSMFLITPYCTFKCDNDCGTRICQNSKLAKSPITEITNEELINRYLSNPITKSIVFGGLEPFDTFEDIVDFLTLLRKTYECTDDVVIYTGYNKKEILDKIDDLKQFSNIIIKFGRYIPDQKYHFDNVLGVELASDNQYAEEIC